MVVAVMPALTASGDVSNLKMRLALPASGRAHDNHLARNAHEEQHSAQRAHKGKSNVVAQSHTRESYVDNDEGFNLLCASPRRSADGVDEEQSRLRCSRRNSTNVWCLAESRQR
jgi:hypothetical protein